jgi:site-specific recombinase XerC
MATTGHVELYVVHLHNENLRAKTIRSHLAALSFQFQSSNQPTPTESFTIDKLLIAYAKTDPPPTIRLPITKVLLAQLLAALNRLPNSQHDRILLTSLLTLMYQALLRVSEVTYSKKNSHNLLPSQVRVNPLNHLKVTFSSFKFSRPGLKSIDIPSSVDSLCPVTAYNSYVAIRSRTAQAAFCHSNGAPLTPAFVTKQLRLLLRGIGQPPLHFNNHSLRIGKATDMAKDGFTDTQICMAGRWSSSAFKQYIKPQLLQLSN